MMLGAKLSYPTNQKESLAIPFYIGKEEAACHADIGKCMPGMNESMQWENH